MRATVPLMSRLPYAGHRRTCYTVAAASVAPTRGAVATSAELGIFVETVLATGLAECVCSLVSTREVPAYEIRDEDEVLVLGEPFLVSHVARMRDSLGGNWVSLTLIGPYLATYCVPRDTGIRRFEQGRGWQ